MNIPDKIKDKITNLIFDTEDCIEYPIINKGGYGSIQSLIGGKKVHFLAHRVAYQIYNNDNLNSSNIICHKCDNPKCINPKHLFKGTNKDNCDDKCNKNRQAIGNKNGRYIDGRCSDRIVHKTHSHGAKLTYYQVLEVKELKNRGVKLIDISIAINIPYHTVRDISCGRIYK